MLLGELIEGLGVEADRPGDLAVRVCDITEDSRTAMPGSLFIARAGSKADGRRFVEQAVRAGAVAVLTDRGAERPAWFDDVAWLRAEDVRLAEAVIAERFFGRPSSRLRVVGVTGTNGKTTVTHLVQQLLNAGGMRCGLIGTVSVDDGRGVSKASMTTPPALELSYSLSKMVESGYAAASIEVSSHALDQRRADGLTFAAAVFTNLTGDHLDYHGTMERYASAKARLFEMLLSEAVAVVNVDDPAHELMLARCRGRVVRCTMEPNRPADCRAAMGRASLAGTPIVLEGPWGTIEGQVRLIGAYNAMNCLQAVAAAHALGVERDTIALALFHLRPPAGRMELITGSDENSGRRWSGRLGDGPVGDMHNVRTGGQAASGTHDVRTGGQAASGTHEARLACPPGQAAAPFAVFVDYSHSDDSLSKALAALRPIVEETGGRLRVVFGCGGDRDRTKRPRMGRVAAELADDVIITSDNPRRENPRSIISEIVSGVDASLMHKVRTEPDRRGAIFMAVGSARPGDVVLIAGKGHEDYQEIADGEGGTRRVPFDDRIIAHEALEGRDHPADVEEVEV